MPTERSDLSLCNQLGAVTSSLRDLPMENESEKISATVGTGPHGNVVNPQALSGSSLLGGPRLLSLQESGNPTPESE